MSSIPVSPSAFATRRAPAAQKFGVEAAQTREARFEYAPIQNASDFES
jgi:hypothetical protein